MDTREYAAALNQRKIFKMVRRNLKMRLESKFWNLFAGYEEPVEVSSVLDSDYTPVRHVIHYSFPSDLLLHPEHPKHLPSVKIMRSVIANDWVNYLFKIIEEQIEQNEKGLKGVYVGLQFDDFEFVPAARKRIDVDYIRTSMLYEFNLLIFHNNTARPAKEQEN